MNPTVNIQEILDSPSRRVYFIGIGGIGMSALARYFLSKGIKVSGYDKTETALTKALRAEGAEIHYTEDVAAVPKDVALVVYTPAVPKDHKELVYYQTNGYNVVKRSDVLGAISESSFNICIGGTHGKTTITTMVAHILRHSGYGCNAFLGGIASNYDTNFWSSDNNVCVIEADEYDRSFLKLSPDVAVITAMDADHLDIYGDEEAVQDAFVQFANKVKEGGLLIGKFGLKRLKETTVKKRWTYSLQNDAADIFAARIKIEEGGYRFDVQLKDKVLSNCELRIGGMHNVENAVAAVAVASSLKIDDEKVKAALAAFKGVHRRFEYVIPPKKFSEGAYVQPVLVDDYAHHPEELRALLTSVRSLFPQRVVTIIFQPHLFSRTRDLAGGFADALSIADRVILLPIYPARELPVEGVSSEMILKGVERDDKQVLSKEEFLAWMKQHAKELNKEFGEVMVMAGAGDIDALVKPVKEMLIG
ncbi:UDP-N-acetylmuramate--L-alanine ligase [Flavisolibacter ginsenosidimutans]|uniref:UDP-N-acetylmuramate--L-alanine ligase n=1 Tax=Flavisolibacter ginsenosidimutans TaxID=661481 RepID=A0A5B8UH98_9BACT|nr:UDP-N-acetylmuramate--L-alanine ligase [Flavisolibacter ginsenosidimutans]QEC56031.1 UDP-N-acetylmuramate--L-alanine ligase [Flavisolibacter ginsenosidimutans]